MKVWNVNHVGGVPTLAPEWSEAERWRLVCKGAWKYDESICLKEARAESVGLRHLARSALGHSCRLLSITDSLASACTFEKMLSNRFGLLALARWSAADCLA